MNKITHFLLKNAVWVVILNLLLGAVGTHYSIRLFSNLRTDLEELLPNDARSVLDLGEVRSRLESTNNIAVLLFSDHPAESRAFVDDFTKEIAKLPPTISAGAEYRINRELQFFNERKSLFIDQNDLNSIERFIKEKINYEYKLYNPLTIFENVNIPEPKLDLKAIEKKYNSKADTYSRFPDGYYATPDQKIRVVLVNLPGSVSGIDGSKNLRHALDEIVTKLNPTKYAPDLAIHYSGGVQDMIEEHEALIEDLALSTIVVCVLVMIAMLIYFRSVIGTFTLVFSLFVGTFMTFGISFFEVGYLNANSAFMGSIVIGNGINFGIILLARFMEERRRRKNALRSIAIAVDKTFPATIVAALAAGLSYGSLMLTSFRGFRQFGIIGLTGMVLCWITSYTLMPSLLVLFYRAGFLRGHVRTPKMYLTRLIAFIVNQYPKAILIFTLLLTFVSAIGLGKIDSNIIETDFKKLRNRHSLESGSMYWSTYVDQVFNRYLTPIVILPKDQKNTELIAEEVRKTKREEGDQSYIVNVSTIRDFVPIAQEQKIKTLRDIHRLLPKHLLLRLPETEQKLARDLLSEESFKQFQEGDLPELVRSKFRERDGTMGKLVLVEPSMSSELAKSNNLIHFVHSVRDAADKIEPGAAVAGTLPVTSDLFESILRDGPKATLFAFISVFLLIILLFRDVITIAQCSFALWIGVLWIFGYITHFHQKINFLNFIALPITFGIGVDYGVNIFSRYRNEKQKGITHTLTHTGGAVLLASLTTIIGYGSLLIASNQAFVSFGRLAVLGELTCVFAAVVSLPALIRYTELRRTKHEK